MNTDDFIFPDEYSVGGWFKWTGEYKAEWTLLFRLTANDKTDNRDTQRAGDTVLTPWAHRNQFYSFWTYSYNDMTGGQNLRVKDDINHKG